MSGPTSWSAADARIVDTNVLLYSYDVQEPRKRAVPRHLLAELLNRRQLCLTAQILNEFFWTATRPRKGPDKSPPLTVVAARRVVTRWSHVVPVLPIDSNTTLTALAAMSPHAMNFSDAFWDALIWASARNRGVAVIYTEDYQAGREVEGVRYVNPFAPGPPIP